MLRLVVTVALSAALILAVAGAIGVGASGLRPTSGRGLRASASAIDRQADLDVRDVGFEPTSRPSIRRPDQVRRRRRWRGPPPDHDPRRRSARRDISGRTGGGLCVLLLGGRARSTTLRWRRVGLQPGPHRRLHGTLEDPVPAFQRSVHQPGRWMDADRRARHDHRDLPTYRPRRSSTLHLIAHAYVEGPAIDPSWGGPAFLGASDAAPDGNILDPSDRWLALGPPIVP